MILNVCIRGEFKRADILEIGRQRYPKYVATLGMTSVQIHVGIPEAFDG